MASSVARMPVPAPADDVFGPHIRLKKVLLRESPSDAQPETPASAMRRRQSQILDRWAARQAREMVTTIERQVELSAAAATQPMSARAAPTFLRDQTSPAAFEPCSSVGSNSVASSAATGDPPAQNVRASSLIQMWRELEAEAGVARTPRTLSGGTTASSSLTNASDDSEASGDSEPEVAVTAAGTSPSVTNNEKGRVGSILRMISFKDRTTTRDAVVMNSSSSSRETNEPAALIRDQQAVRQEAGFALPSGGLVRLRSRRDIEDMMERMRKERQRNIEELGERHVVSRFSHRGRIQSVLKLRFLRRESAVQDQPRPTSKKRGTDRSQSGPSILLLREIFDNATQHSGNEAQTAESSKNGSVHEFPSTSQDPMHSASQLNITNYQYQEVVSTGDQEIPQPEMNSACSRSEEAFELNSPRSRTEDRIELDSPNTRAEDVAEVDSLNSRNEGMCGGLNSPRCRSEDMAELNSPGSVSEDTPELNSPRYISQDLQEIQNPDSSWDERSLWVSNVDWQRAIESSSPSQGWQGEVENEEIEPYTRQHVADIGHIWIGSCSPSWRGWALEGQDYYDFLENFSDNTEIRELLERRRVSTSLASDFCGKMNQMILTFLNRQDQVQDENYSDEYEEQPIWRQNYELDNADHQVASESSLVLPSSYQSMHYPESWQYTSFTHNLSLDTREPENVNDLKTEMAQMRQEISQLRKLVESCMEQQTKLQHTIKEEISHAVSQSVTVTVANTQDRSRWTPNRKDTCCICYEAQIDSLLYRCGHMCTCFKCAQELQWSSGRCPICRSSIADVVRVYPNSRG